MKPRERILKAADEIFGEVGFDAATTREIAARSQVNKALIHYHFQSKEGLFSDLLDTYYQKLREMLGQALQSEGSLTQRMTFLVDAYIDFLKDNINFGRMIQREASASGGNNRERIHEHMIPLFDIGRRAIEAIYPSTRSGALAAEQILVSFYGMIITYFTYSDLLQDLLGRDMMSEQSLEIRRAHIHRMIEITLTAVQEKERCI